jgi:hypothetical protein
LLEYKDIKIVVSTVGLMETPDEVLLQKNNYTTKPFTPIGAFDRHFETMAFHAKKDDIRYHDADVTKQVYFASPWSINKIDADDEANNMHEVVIEEITTGLLAGETYEPKEIF